MLFRSYVDPIFFLYHDDLDFGWRANLLGYSSFFEPEISIYHYGSPNLKWSKEKFYYLERNRWICLKTLYSKKTYKKIFPYLMLFEFGMFFFLLSKGLVVPKIKSIISIWKLRKEIEKKRKETLNLRKIDDIKVVKNFTTEFYYPESLTKGRKRSLITIIIENLSKKALKKITT